MDILIQQAAQAGTFGAVAAALLRFGLPWALKKVGEVTSDVATIANAATELTQAAATLTQAATKLAELIDHQSSVGASQ